jgi:hypothetical protein
MAFAMVALSPTMQGTIADCTLFVLLVFAFNRNGIGISSSPFE